MIDNPFSKLEEKLNTIIEGINSLNNRTDLFAKNRKLEDDNDLVSIQEAAKLTGYSVNYIYELKFKNAIPYFKIGKSLRFSKMELENWIKSGRANVLQQGVDAIFSNNQASKNS